MGVSSLLNASKSDSSISHSGLTKIDRQGTFVLGKIEDNLRDQAPSEILKKDEHSLLVSKKEEIQARSIRLKNFSRQNNYDEYKSTNRENQEKSDEESINHISSNIRFKLRSRFNRISIDENLKNKSVEKQEFNNKKYIMNNRLDETYLQTNKLMSIVTGTEKANNSLINYQKEYDFFTKTTKSSKNSNKLDNLSGNQVKNYIKNNHNLYYPSLEKAKMLINYPNLNEEIKNLIAQCNSSLFNKLTQRILIEKNENLKQKDLNLILNNERKFFILTTNLEKEDCLIQPKVQNQENKENRTLLSSEKNLMQTFREAFNLQSISLRFFRHKHSTDSMNLSSKIISNFEFINELKTNEYIDKLTAKIEKLKEIVEMIENCVSDYSLNDKLSNENKNVQAASMNLLQTNLSFLAFLYIERDKLIEKFRKTLFNLLKDWKEINPFSNKINLKLKFEENNELYENDQAKLNSLVEERFEIEKKIIAFNKLNTQINRSLKNMFDKLIENSQSNENLENEEKLYLRLKNQVILLDGRFPGEPRFHNFKLLYEQKIENENIDNEIRNEITQCNMVKAKNKLKERKYLIQIFNKNQLICETQKNELDQNLQIKFNNFKFIEISTFENSVICNLVELKKNKKKVIAKLKLDIYHILTKAHLHNTLNFSVKANFENKLENGEIVFNLEKEKKDNQYDNLFDRNIFKINKEISKKSVDSTNEQQAKNLFIIKFDIDREKLTEFKFRALSEKERIIFLIGMKSEIYNQQKLNKLVSMIKKDKKKDKQEKTVLKKNDPINLFNLKLVELDQRMILLKERNDEDEPNKCRIPLYDSQYLSFLIKNKQHIKNESNNLVIELNKTSLNVDLLKAYDKKKKAIIDHLIDVKKKFIDRSNSLNKNLKNYEDYIYEEIDTSLSTLNFDFLFFSKELKRPLRPNRKERKKYSGQALAQQLNSKTTNYTKSNQIEKVKIMINIMSGINIPVRKLHDHSKEIDRLSSQQFKSSYTDFTKKLNELYHDEMHSYTSMDSIISKNVAIDLSSIEQKVCPFVEVSFQNQIAQTSVAESNQPTWHETIKLDLNVPNDDYSPANLLKIYDFIYLNLFDYVEVKEGKIELEKTFHSENNSAKANTRKWLGSISIPFITLYLNGKIEGTLCTQQKPTYLSDYDFETKPIFSSLNPNKGQELDSSYINNLNPKKNSHINLFLTIDPQLNLPNKIDLKCSSEEEAIIYNYAKNWQWQSKKKYPGRLIKSLVINLSNGKHTLVTRFLSPFQPPKEFLNTEQYNESTKDYKIMMKNLARYVSLIPTITNELASVGLIEELIWADCEQFLQMNIGSVWEHAILLCNYFLYLGLNSGLVLGTCAPQGKTCYVIVWLHDLNKREDDLFNVQLWHPLSGQCYYVHTGSFLPFSSADCIITKDNVYASLQKEEQLNQISFNILKTNFWKPLFNFKKMKVNLNTIQPSHFMYDSINENFARNLEQQIEVYLRESLMKWRRQNKTFFNRFCTKEIKRELAQMEFNIFYPFKNENIDPNEQINKILSAYNIDGFQLNLPFDGVDQIAQLIYSTGFHLTTDDKVNFVIAVHVHAYPQNVYSVWIYCAHIRTK